MSIRMLKGLAMLGPACVLGAFTGALLELLYLERVEFDRSFAAKH